MCGGKDWPLAFAYILKTKYEQCYYPLILNRENPIKIVKEYKFHLSAVRDVCVVVKTGLWPLHIF